MKQYYLIFILVCFASRSFAQTLEDDRLALIAVYTATVAGMGGNPYGGLGDQGVPGSSPCGWKGVTCSGGRVSELNIIDGSLSGYLPGEIGNLTALTKLVLKRTFYGSYGIRGVIPVTLGNLVNLEYLDLGGNSFTGQLPTTIGNLSKLTYLNLSYFPFARSTSEFGGLTGAIPVEIGNLANLIILNISDQNLKGNLPAELGNLTKLEVLSLANNDFTGSIPSSLGNLSSLKTINLAYGLYPPAREPKGHLSGSIPASFVNLTNLQLLDITRQSLSNGIANLSGVPTTATVNISENSFNFNGMENNINRLDFYNDQAIIPLHIVIPLAIPVGPSGPYGFLSVDAGGTLANNTYKWYKDGVPVLTKTGDASFIPPGLGVYHVTVSNSLIPNLTLVSDAYTITSPFPVNLTSFTGENTSSGNVLSWKTTSETNNKGFQIERSADAKTFESIGLVDGLGDNLGEKTYTFLDTKPYFNTYYRLKQLDWDEKSEYSRIIMVKQDKTKLSVYPNPAKNEFFVSGLDREEAVEIRNATGRIVLEQKVNPAQPVRTDKLLNGLYVIKVGEETRKIVIQN
jgi:hypothetical protein